MIISNERRSNENELTRCLRKQKRWRFKAIARTTVVGGGAGFVINCQIYTRNEWFITSNSRVRDLQYHAMPDVETLVSMCFGKKTT
jgi:hypothetical protein